MNQAQAIIGLVEMNWFRHPVIMMPHSVHLPRNYPRINFSIYCT